MPITKSQVESAIKKGTPPDVPSSARTDEATSIYGQYKGWHCTNFNFGSGGTISDQTSSLITRLSAEHQKAESEFNAKKSTIGSVLGATWKALGGKNASSWFNYMVSALKLFGEYVTQELEDHIGTDKTDKKKNVRLLSLAVSEMIDKYINHFIFCKLTPFLKDYLDNTHSIMPESDWLHSRMLIALLEEQTKATLLNTNITNLMKSV